MLNLVSASCWSAGLDLLSVSMENVKTDGVQVEWAADRWAVRVSSGPGLPGVRELQDERGLPGGTSQMFIVPKNHATQDRLPTDLRPARMAMVFQRLFF